MKRRLEQAHCLACVLLPRFAAAGSSRLLAPYQRHPRAMIIQLSPWSVMSSRPLLPALVDALAPTTFAHFGIRRLSRRYGRPPRRSPSDHVPGPGVKDVVLRTVNALTLRGWLLAAEHSDPRRPAAIVVHGWGGSAVDMLPVSRPLLAAGLDVLLLDTRCHGRSDDDELTSMPAFGEDVQAALGWLREQPTTDPDRIVLVGHSVGAGACLLVAARDPSVAAVVSLAAMADPHAFMSRALRRRLPGPLTVAALRFVEHAIGHRFEEFAPLHTISRVRAPVLLLHGALDATVPIADAYRLHAQAPLNTSLVVVPDADHVSVEAFDRLAPTVHAFLRTAGVLTTAAPT